MQKTHTILLAAFLLMAISTQAQVIQKGDILINPYYGAWGMNMEDESPAADESDVTYNSGNTIGLRGQVLAVGLGGDANLGFGIDVGNTTDSFDWMDRSGLGDVQRNWKRSTTFIGVFADAHVIQTATLDVSLAASVGYGFVKNSESPQSDEFGSYPENRTMYNIDAGIAYFVIDNLALTLRGGIGTNGVLMAGLMFRL
jgi:hypothetical protein